jgi:hypothetical protein
MPTVPRTRIVAPSGSRCSYQSTWCGLGRKKVSGRDSVPSETVTSRMKP